MVSPGNLRRNYNSHSLNMHAAGPAEEYTPPWIITPSIAAPWITPHYPTMD
jgi:hypothetical protein